MKAIKKKNILILLLLLLLCIPAIIPLLHKGFFVTDDADWMIIRFTAFYQAIHDGQFPVRFLTRLNFGYGYPVATFLYPGFMYLAVPLHLVKIGFVDSIKIILGASMIFSGVFMYLWLRRLYGNFASFFGALVYVYTPYHLYDLTRRGSVGELLSLVVIPFVFWQIDRKSLFWSSLGIALLILAHNTLAVLFLPILVAYMIYMVLQTKKRKSLLLNAFFSLLIGFGISAFFWVPILFELHNTVFAKTTVSDWSKYFASISLIGYSTFVVLLIVLALLVLKRVGKNNGLLLVVFLLSSVLLFFSSSISSFVWNFLPATFIQFPFRLLSALLVCIAFLSTIVISMMKGKGKYYLSGVFIVVLLASSFPFFQPISYVDRGDAYYATNDATTTVQDEYMPIWVKEKPHHRSEKKVEVKEGMGTVTNIVETGKKIAFAMDGETASIVRVNTIYWPGWKAYVDGKEVAITYNNKGGLIEFSVPQERHTVEVVFGETPLRLLADGISVISLIFLIIVSQKLKLKSQKYK